MTYFCLADKKQGKFLKKTLSIWIHKEQKILHEKKMLIQSGLRSWQEN